MRTTYCYWVRGQEFAQMAAKSIESIRRFDRFMVERRFLVVTDTWETFDCFGKDVEIIYIQEGRPAMVANLDAQIAALFDCKIGERILFLDADTLMAKEFPWTDNDIHATWRDDVNGDIEMARSQPWNYGVLGVNVNPQTIEAFIWLRHRILKMSPASQDWYGNQLALAELLGAPNVSDSVRRIKWSLNDKGTAITLCSMPCEVWNWTPNQEGEDIKGKGIIHCKGKRKGMLEHYAQRLAE